MRNEVGESFGLFDMFRFCAGDIWGGEAGKSGSNSSASCGEKLAFSCNVVTCNSRII